MLVLLVGGGYLVTQALKSPGALGPITTPTAATSTAATSSTVSTSTQASATSSSSGYPGFSQSGSTLSGSNFTAVLPTGWTVSAHNGGDNEGQIIDENSNLIDYFTDFPRTPADNCSHQASAVAQGSTVETANPPVPVSAVWAGETASGLEVTLKRTSQTNQEVVGFYCIDHGGVSVAMRTIAWQSNQASVQTGVKQLLASWKWR